MQENVTIFKADTTDAIKSVQDLRQHIKDLQDSLVNMEKDTEAYDKAVEDLVASQTKLNEVMSITRKNVGAAEGSYNNLVNQMNALKTAWRATTSEVQRAQLGEKIRAINDQLKEYDATIGNHQRKVGSYEEALQALTKTYDSQKQELAALKTALDNLEPGSEAYNEAFERASEITHNLQERQEQLRMSANDLGTQLSNVMSIGTGLVSGFNAINAIMALTGQKNEDLQKTMVKLQAGIALVQSAKGLEGAVKSMKAYANWAAKAYDSIVDWISGSKKQQKQIEATTKAAQANATVNNQVAASEGAAATGANALGAGMTTAAAGTTTATAAMTAFKAVLMSLGIGLVVAAIAGLVTMLGKLAGKSKEAYNAMAVNAQNLIDIEEEASNRVDLAMQHRWELEKAQGKDDIELAKEKYDYYEQRLNRYTDLIVSANNLKSDLESWGFKGNKGKSHISNLELPELQILGKNLVQVEKELEKMESNGNLAFKKLSASAIEEFDKIKEKGIKTFGDIYTVVDLYGKALAEEKTAYTIDPLAGLENDVKVQAETYIKEAQDAVKSEIQLENEGYNTRKALLEKYGYDTTALTKAHNKKVYEMVTAATQSILDSAKAANQTELDNLEDKYQKEREILRQYGRDTTDLDNAYQKQRQQIQYNNEVKALENTIKFTEQTKAAYKQTYDELNAMGIARAEDVERIQKEEHEITSKALKEQLDKWKDLYDKYYEDEKLTEEQRLSIKEKYLDAKKALEKEDTDYLLQQIKTRKQALDEEIAEIEKNYSNVSKMQSLNTEAKYTSKTDFGSTWWGASQQPSYKQQKDDLNGAYGIEAARLQEEIEYYQHYAQEIAKTDAEITYAREQEAQKRMELATLERENYLDNLHIEIDESKEIISTIVDVGNSIGSILGSVADAWQDSVEAQVKAGDMSQEEADKQMENVRALQIVQATINMLAGSFGAFAQASSTIPPPYGQIVGAAAAAAVIAQGIAQIAAIRNAGKNSGSGGSTMMAQVTPVMTDYQPEYVANATGEQETERLANALASTPIWVSVQDIDAAQEKGRTRVAESTF